MAIDMEDRGQALENEYFHRKERELIEKMRTKMAAEEANDPGLTCPKCGGAWHETDYEDIKIDVCDKCGGVWFDAGELAQIVDKEEKGGGWFAKIFS
jgi:uncharacterized protein